MVPRRRRIFRLRRATKDDLPILVDHRIGMFRAFGRHGPAQLAAHRPAYLRWLRPKVRSGEIVGLLAVDEDGTPLGSGCLWFQPSIPRPGAPRPTVPYVLSMFTRPSARGQGVASAIVREFLRLSRERGYPGVRLHASTKGRSVYRGLGFVRSWEMRRALRPVRPRRRVRTA